MKRLTLLFSILLCTVACAEPLIIETSKGPVTLDVEIAKDLQQGLMFRTHLDPLSGMLFVYPNTHIAKLWMKNTLIPLDMVFIDEGGIIVYIHQNAEPKSLKTITANKTVKAVLEINGGHANKLGLGVGDIVVNFADWKLK